MYGQGILCGISKAPFEIPHDTVHRQYMAMIIALVDDSSPGLPVSFRLQYSSCKLWEVYPLTNWGRNEMDVILQAIFFSNSHFLNENCSLIQISLYSTFTVDNTQISII